MKESLLAGADDSRAALPVAICDVAGLTDADLATVDDLARLQLIARRLGITLELHDAPRELRELLDFAGLRDVVRCPEPLPVEVRGQAEQREEPRRVEEEADPGDPIA
jgi:ABC-type transporter Mla MlaB component